MEGVVREFEVEERRLGLLELARRGQHVMGQPRRLGQRDVDDHQQFQRLERLAAGAGVGDRVGRVAAFHDHGAEPVRVIGQDLLRHCVRRHQAAHDRGAGHRRLADTHTVVEQRTQGGVQVRAALLGEVAREDPQQLVQVGAQRAVRGLLHTEVLEDRNAAGRRDPPRRGAQQLAVDPAALGVVVDRDLAQDLADGVGPQHVVGEKRFVAEVLLHQDSGQGGQAPGVRAGLYPQVEVGHLRGVGDHRVDHDHRAPRILGDLVEHGAGPREALRHPRVLADEHRDLGMLEFAAGVPAVEVRIHPRLAGLLLRQRVGAVPGAKRLEEGAAVGAAEVVALAAAAVVEDLVPAVVLGDALEAHRDLGDRGVPVDLLVAAVRPATQRRGQPRGGVLVVVEAQRLVAGVALRRRVVLVAANLGQVPSFGLDDDAAVALTEDAGGGLPVSGHGGAPF